jgi:SAM-dependent methyltransferase
VSVERRRALTHARSALVRWILIAHDHPIWGIVPKRRVRDVRVRVLLREDNGWVSDVRVGYEQFLRLRHRPAHARRTVASVAAFFVAHVRRGDCVLDLGCGPGSVTAGLVDAVGPSGVVVGIDLDPGPAPVPLVRGDIHGLPFADCGFDAIFMCAVLQHIADPLRPLLEACRIARPGAVIGVADADWGGALLAPEDRWLIRGNEIMTELRAATSPYVGRHLRGLLHAAGFVDVRVTAHGTGGGGPGCVAEAEFQASFFDARAVVAMVTHQGLATAEEMAAIAAAWRRWGEDPSATSARHWFEAIGHAPTR